MIDARMFTVGPVQENCYVVRAAGGDRAVIVDPGEEAPRLLAALDELGVTVEAILLTHTHFDHVGAVAPVAQATGAPVWCPEIERPVLADIMRWVPWPGFGPFESYEADHLLAGGETLQLAGMTFDVAFTPGHSPGHVTYAVVADDDREAAPALFSGDVLFQGSIGRTDLPGGDHARLLQSIAELLDAYPDEAVVHPGHMGITTLGAERASNPFLQALAR
ncbi:MAG TPA: MBL fold metallo-hydrolase [Conexibacter sp.]|jgi:hydroxyacylglutathione hydrolase|nr:MBL fold metallo-hydrolase [Conexibacter sp.]